MESLKLVAAQTALVAIDLQNLVVSFPTQPRESRVVVDNTARIAAALRNRGGFIVWVRVAMSPDGKDRLHPVSDQQFTMPRELPPAPMELVAGLGVQPGDHLVTKRQWGAFYGTDLELQLRRRGLTTIILTGIATAFGVESTARAAFELGYEQVFAEDAMSSMTAAQHEHVVSQILPRIGRVRRTEEIVAALG